MCFFFKFDSQPHLQLINCISARMQANMERKKKTTKQWEKIDDVIWCMTVLQASLGPY